MKGRDERLSRMGLAKAGVPGVNALFCRAEARGFQKKGLTLGQPSRMRGRERRLSALEPREPGAWMERWPSLPAHLTESWGVAGFDPALEFLHFSGGSGDKLSGEGPNIEMGDQFRALAGFFAQECNEIKTRGTPRLTPPFG